MQFRVVGCQRQTGAGVSVVIDAATPSAAEELGNSMNIMVERIEAVAVPVAPQILPQAPPMAPQSAPPPQPTRYVQTVEKTGKGWKAAMLLAGLAMCVGVFLIVFELTGNGGGAMGGVGILLLAGGFVLGIISRVGAWWFHG